MVAEAVDQFSALEAVGGRLARFCYTGANDRGKAVGEKVGIDEGGAGTRGNESRTDGSCGGVRGGGQGGGVVSGTESILMGGSGDLKTRD